MSIKLSLYRDCTVLHVKAMPIGLSWHNRRCTWTSVTRSTTFPESISLLPSLAATIYPHRVHTLPFFKILRWKYCCDNILCIRERKYKNWFQCFLSCCLRALSCHIIVSYTVLYSDVRIIFRKLISREVETEITRSVSEFNLVANRSDRINWRAADDNSPQRKQ